MSRSELIIIGSTGSIGKSALRVVDQFPERFCVKGLSCSSNVAELALQIKKYSPAFAAVNGAPLSQVETLSREFPDVQFFSGVDALSHLVREGADILLNSVVGAAGLVPTLESLRHIKRLAIANKETLVIAGDIVKAQAARYGVEIIPVDSEHSAIFSLLENRDEKTVRRIILTASGGSLRDKTKDEIALVTPEEALRHPTWSMGSKITIDSATLVNKGLEVIEAHHLFNMPYDKIDVVIHPESVIHSMIETTDGSVYAHMGVADMALPIMGALSYPEKLSNPFASLDFSRLKSLTFREYDPERFPALKLCYEAGKLGGSATAALNAANEIAVGAFLDKRIPFPDIVFVIDEAMQRTLHFADPSLEQLIETDRNCRAAAENIIRRNER